MVSTDIPPGRLRVQAGRLQISGNWTLEHHAALKAAVRANRGVTESADETLDLSDLAGLDTAGASLLVELLGAERVKRIRDWAPDLPAERQALLETVAGALETPLTPERRRSAPLADMLVALGERIHALWQQQRQLLGFMGLTLAALTVSLLRPWRWRITSLVSHIHQTGLNAVPIVALLTFLVGAVVAFLGATVLRDFGATIYTVNLVAFAFLREFGVLLAAILLAGRTASAFTAQIGSMKANEEVDAIRALGLDPIELLVLPRLLAMMVTLPILTFVGMLSGILGGAMVCQLMLDIPMVQFIAILQRDIPLNHFLVGIGKAPLFAFLIAVIGCLEGFKVSGSARSVGEHTTSSVVQSIFMVILLDAVAALFFMEMGW
ncbi:phospholipid/cholesterol/gamma-HCH transport system permease protein [Halomonas campaniensis]|uniref:Phospholipid/cholesterol/gamma-HCH transport system permease protein n=1 Tax=Halomonas campaniensis TaxID=213554 RepID=A0A7W5K3V0_9GAMM|nr:ABC transporter permease [Halomonas campaniensis]MBB3330887.1 phospholipid/cholesterol/gamma-HCH transport system permease protein [Halomonas campaniensis]